MNSAYTNLYAQLEKINQCRIKHKTMKTKFSFLCLMLGLILNINAQIPTDGLVGYWPFNGNANDESGTENNGAVFGATLTTDRFDNENSAYSFDGDDYIKASSDSLPTHERTTCLWFNAETLTTRPALLGYGGKGSPGTSWWMNLNHGGTLAYFLGFHYSQSNYLFFNYEIEPVDTWIFFVTTTDTSGCKIYINGVMEASNSNFITNTYVAGKDLAIGVNVSGVGIAPYTDSNVGYFKGKIDDVRIYNRALTSEEIDILYKEGANVGIKPPDNLNTLQVYPNPARDVIYIHTGENDPSMANCTIRIINSHGQTIFESNVTEQLFEVDVSTVGHAGLCVIQIIDNASQIIGIRKVILE